MIDGGINELSQNARNSRTESFESIVLDPKALISKLPGFQSGLRDVISRNNSKPKLSDFRSNPVEPQKDEVRKRDVLSLRGPDFQRSVHSLSRTEKIRRCPHNRSVHFGSITVVPYESNKPQLLSAAPPPDLPPLIRHYRRQTMQSRRERLTRPQVILVPRYASVCSKVSLIIFFVVMVCIVSQSSTSVA